MADAPRHTNRLIDETSPYLRQHAHNPVDWYPWGDEALGRARDEDRPILLSIGYSACHWCHVMAHESFENEAIAGVMNEHFVNIKVDREERPDLDSIYQTVCQVVTRSGGWPLTVFLTPDQKPFYVGTYFPPSARYGRPGFGEVCLAVAGAYRQQRDQVTEQASQLVDVLGQVQAPSGGDDMPGDDVLAHAYRELDGAYDAHHGGFGGAPKFPNPFNLQVLLHHYARTREAKVLEQVVHTCRMMRAGGLYDQLGHGFHRYSVDDHWAVPHFEKMLYDNALLPPVYLAGWQASGDAALAATVVETLEYLLDDMRDPGGALYSTTDADSEGEEGRYFVWTPQQVAEVLDERDTKLVCERFGITDRGNFEHGTTVLSLTRSVNDLAAENDLTPEAVAERLEHARRRLLEARAEREAPGRDEKILTGWNGLALVAFARAGLALGEPRYLDAARDIASFVLEHLSDGDRLLRVHKDGQSKIDGYLEDYAAFGAGLLELFCATGEPRWYERAVAFTETVLREFRDEQHGDFFMTRAGGEELVTRPKDIYDSATPSGLSSTAHNLVTLHHLSGEERYRAAAAAVFKAHAGAMRQNAWGMANLLVAHDRFLAEPDAVVVAGDGPAADALLRAATADYAPHRLVVRRRPDDADDALPALLHGRTPREGAAAYACRGFTCQAPVTEPEALRQALEA